jgi:diguanylate cyclase (GGDEF)-like protein
VQAAWLTTAGVRVAASPAAAAALGIFSLGPTMAGTVLGVAGPERYLGFLWVVNLTAALGIARYVGQMLCKLMLSEKRLAEANAHLTELSATDSLTGIGNRRAFDAALRAEWGRALRDGTDLGVLVMDVDHFKAFNDAYGHPAGDDCLRRIAAILLRAMRRPTDMSARYGGEEFVALMPGTDGPGAQAAAERTRQAIWDGALPHEGSSFGRVSVSVGAASLSPLPGDDPQALIDLADRALYAAKLAGRNRVVLADGSEASPGSSAPWVGARVAAWPFLAPDPPANGWPRSRL